MVERFKMEIRNHFESELELKKDIFKVEEQMETLGFTLFKAMKERKKVNGK